MNYLELHTSFPEDLATFSTLPDLKILNCLCVYFLHELCVKRHLRFQVFWKEFMKFVLHELRKVGYDVTRLMDIHIVYEGIPFDEGLRLDILVGNKKDGIKRIIL